MNENITVEIKYRRKKIYPIVFVNGVRGRLYCDDGSRYVYNCGPYYFKIDRTPNKEDWTGIKDHTKYELEFWNKYKKSKYAKHLVPILAHGVCEKGFTWIVEPTCKKHRNSLSKKDYEFLEQICNDICICDLWEPKTPEQGHKQWGYLNGNPVIFDYAINSISCEREHE